MRSKRKSERGWPARILMIAIAIVILAPFFVLGAYIAAARWLLTGPKLRALINAQPDMMMIDWAEAVSRFPGRVSLKNVSVRGSDPYVQWIVRMDSADVEISIPALMSKTLRFTSLRASGISFHLRSKVPADAAKSLDMSVIPPIPGFPDPPVRLPGKTFPPADPRALLLDMRAVFLDHLEDIWIDAYRYQGPARAEGSFQLRPLQFAQIGPAKLVFNGGEARIGKAEAGFTLDGTVVLKSDGFAPLDMLGNKVFAVTSGDVKLETGFKIQALAPLFPDIRSRLQGGSGKATIAATIVHGVTKANVAIAVQDAVVQLDLYKLQGNADIRAAIPRINLLGGPIDVSGSRVILADVRVFGSTDPRRWSGRFDVRSGKVDVTTTATVEAKTQDARPLLAVLGVALPPWTKDLVDLKDFSGGARASVGPSAIRIQGFEARGGDFHIQGHYVREKAKTDGAFLIESGILSVGVELDGKKAKVRPLFAKQWFAKQGDGALDRLGR
jgi:hypothetical protein